MPGGAQVQGGKPTGGSCESLALAAVGTGCNTTAWTGCQTTGGSCEERRGAGAQTGEGLEAGAAAARRLGASPGKAALVARVPGCAVAALGGGGDSDCSLVIMEAK